MVTGPLLHTASIPPTESLAGTVPLTRETSRGATLFRTVHPQTTLTACSADASAGGNHFSEASDRFRSLMTGLRQREDEKESPPDQAIPHPTGHGVPLAPPLSVPEPEAPETCRSMDQAIKKIEHLLLCQLNSQAMSGTWVIQLSSGSHALPVTIELVPTESGIQVTLTSDHPVVRHELDRKVPGLMARLHQCTTQPVDVRIQASMAYLMKPMSIKDEKSCHTYTPLKPGTRRSR